MNKNLCSNDTSKKINSIVNRTVFNPSERLDVIQDVWLHVLEGLKDNYIEKGLLDSWIWRITRNTCYDYYRKRIKEKEMRRYYRLEVLSTLGDGPNLRLIQKAILDDCNRELSEGVPSLELQVLREAFLRLKNKSEISRDLGISRKKVDKILKDYYKIPQKKYDELNK